MSARCFVAPACWDGDEIALPADEAHYLTHVLRLGLGSEVAVFDGQGREGSAAIVAVRHGGVRLGRLKPARSAPIPEVRLSLVQALPKRQKMDLIVEKASELGFSEILPTICDRVEKRPDARSCGLLRERWKRVALAATRQCRGAWMTEILPLCDYEAAVEHCRAADLFLVGALGAERAPLRAAIAEAKKRGKLSRVALLIGPEGDFTQAEMDLAAKAGAVPVSFGSSVLRTETAAIFGMSILAYEFTAMPEGCPACS